MKKHVLILGAFVCMSLFSCNSDNSTDPNEGGENDEVSEEEMEEEVDEVEEGASTPNVLLVIADDMGLDATPGYSEIESQKPNMPTLQGFVDNGIRFTNVWAYPTCTPTRSSIITGKYGFRTDVMGVGDQLSTSETTLQNYINSNTNEGYAQAVIGKWHLSNDEDHPSQMGIPYYAGILGGTPRAYDNWNFTTGGSTTNSREYITTKFTDLAIDWLGEQTKPWFLWLAYTAPHVPFHLPPDNLHSQGALPTDDASIADNPLPYFFAMLEAMDTELGRLLGTLSEETLENTVIIFIGDNGTTSQTAQEYRSNRVKGSVYQGGINVPMVISGKNVSRVKEVEDAFINSTDLFATIADLTGSGVAEINDSISFKNLLSAEGDSRIYTYSEVRTNSGGIDYTMRNTTHKYISFNNGSEALYNLTDDPFEITNLLSRDLTEENALIKEELLDELAKLKEGN